VSAVRQLYLLPMKLIWADRIAIFWAALLSLFFFCLNGREAIAGMLSDPNALFVLFGIPWIVLRLIDWVCGGPTARRRYAPPRARNWASDGVMGTDAGDPAGTGARGMGCGAGTNAGTRRYALLLPKAGVGED
jgi:hypothetical protein